LKMESTPHKWKKPLRHLVGFPCGDSKNRSCWDCEHIRIAGFLTRMCVRHPKRHIYGIGLVETEVFEEEDSGRVGSVADRCPDFRVDEFWKGVIIWDEKPF
jgi:hypothetical protein